MTASRIFIGGIPPGTTNEDLAQRFKSFGEIKSCEVVPDKEYPPPLMHNSEDPMVFTRNFGFVTIEPKDEKSLQRAIGVYNGSLWRGCTLRCKLAKPTMMERLEEEKKEEEEKSKEDVDYTLPQAEEGTTLRIRQPFNHQLVSVVLGGSELKLEKLKNTASSFQQKQGNLPSSSTALEKNIVSTPLKVRKTFEQHLRDCAEKYAASEEGQRAAALRQERLENTKAAAAADQETAVNISLNKDAAALTAGGAGGANKKGQNTQTGRATKEAAGGIGQKQQQKQTQERMPKQTPGGSLFPAKRSMEYPLEYAPPAQRSRIVDFLDEEDFTALQQQKNTAVDLSRFGSDSEEDEEKEENDKLVGKNGGKFVGGGGGLVKKTIPQVDGAAESSETTNGDHDDEDDDGTSSSGTSSSSSDDSTSSDDNRTSDDDVSSSSDSEESEDEDEQKVARKVLSKDPELKDPGRGGSNLNKNKISTAGGDAAWMAEYLPAGASFFRQDSLVQVEAAWRAGREAAVREYKERRRQALRQAGKRGGGASGGKERK